MVQGYGLGMNLHAVAAVCSVACLEWSGWIQVRLGARGPRGAKVAAVETSVAKEARKRERCRGKPLDCPIRLGQGKD
ncbi:MAG: hypothetical protein PWP58_723 [Bacillota bacterium]|nr:hypothetical protein [Bacillota bacterium]